ncbi:MAG TPA: hypothetical protein VIL69_23155 [Roseomonas sp.]
MRDGDQQQDLDRFEEFHRAAWECAFYAQQAMNYAEIGDVTGMRRSRTLAEGAAIRMGIHLTAIEASFPERRAAA